MKLMPLENTKNNEIELLELQLIISTIFTISSVISILLTFDVYLKKTNQQPLFTDSKATEIEINNRLVVLAIILVFLFINYNNFITNKNNNSSNQTDSLQVLSSLLTTIAAIIVLYITFKNKDNKLNIDVDIDDDII